MRKGASVPVDDVGEFVRHHLLEDIVEDRRKVSHQYIHIADHPRRQRPERAGLRIPLAKRSFDTIVASVVSLCVLPCFLAIALAIKLTSRGPILFRQRRYGLKNKAICDNINFGHQCYSDKERLQRGLASSVGETQRVIALEGCSVAPTSTSCRSFSMCVKASMSLVRSASACVWHVGAGVPYEILCRITLSATA